MKTFQVYRDPNECGNLYLHKEFTFQPGVTVLCGCNGSGKTSLLKQLKWALEKEDTAVLSFNNLLDGGSNARSKAGYLGDMDFLATSVCSSEGENIVLNMGNVARGMGRLVRDNKDAKELWFLFDAIDSGLSIDNVLDIKEYLFKTVLEHNSDKDVYIIVSANEYELCRDENCMDIYSGKYMKFKTYEDFRNFIIKSRERKDAREEKQRNKHKKN